MAAVIASFNGLDLLLVVGLGALLWGGWRIYVAELNRLADRDLAERLERDERLRRELDTPPPKPYDWTDQLEEIRSLPETAA